MSWSWNDPIDETTNIQSAEFLNTILAACHERGIALDVSPVQVGDDIQDHTWLRAIQDKFRFQFGLWLPRTTIPQDYIDSTVVFWDFAQLREHLGFGTLTSWRRKKPREIMTLSDTFDTNLNPAVDGQKAIRLWSVDGSRPQGVYERIDGVWRLSYGQPDVLDSDLPVPNHVQPGLHRAGDYIGAFLYREIRDMLNEMTVKGMTLPVNINHPSSQMKVGEGSIPIEEYVYLEQEPEQWPEQLPEHLIRDGMSAAMALAEADYAANPATPYNATAYMLGIRQPGLARTLGLGISHVVQNAYYISSCDALITRSQAVFTIDNLLPCRKHIDYFNRAFHAGGWASLGYHTVFDPVDDPVSAEVEGVHHWYGEDVDESTSRDTAVLGSLLLPDTGAIPCPSIDVPFFTRTVHRGYQATPWNGASVGHIQAMINYEVEGGFQYTLNT